MRIGQIGVMAAAALLAMQSQAVTNYVQNGDFEASSGTGELAQGIATTAAWAVGATTDGSADPFVFIVDTTADDGHHTATGGFRSVFFGTYGYNIHIYGPDNGHNNGFTGSANGGYFFGADAAYANAPISQTISGLTVGKTYELSFEYASAQFTDANGVNTSGWDVTFGGTPVASVSNSNADMGFVDWQTKTVTVTATNTSQVLTFLATGGPSGLPPFALLDGVKLVDPIVPPPPPPPPPPVPEPESLAMLLAGAAVVGFTARRRRRA